jgi:hypothetical protein
MKNIKKHFKSFIKKLKFFAIALFIFNFASVPVSAAIEVPGDNHILQFDSCRYGGEDYDFCDEITKTITLKNVYENPSIDETIKQVGVTFSSGNNFYEIMDPSDGSFKHNDFIFDADIAKGEDFDLKVVSIASDSRLEDCLQSGNHSCDWNIDANIQLKYCNPTTGDCYWHGGSTVTLKRSINVIDVNTTPSATSVCEEDFNPGVENFSTNNYFGNVYTTAGEPVNPNYFVEVYYNNQLVGCKEIVSGSIGTVHGLAPIHKKLVGGPEIPEHARLEFRVNGVVAKTTPNHVEYSSSAFDQVDLYVNALSETVDLSVSAYISKNWGFRESRNLIVTVWNRSNVAASNVPVSIKMERVGGEVVDVKVLNLVEDKSTVCTDVQVGFGEASCVIANIPANEKVKVRFNTLVSEVGDYTATAAIDINDKNESNNQRTTAVSTIGYESRFDSVEYNSETQKVEFKIYSDFYIHYTPLYDLMTVVIKDSEGNNNTYDKIYIKNKTNQRRWFNVKSEPLESGEYTFELYFRINPWDDNSILVDSKTLTIE